MPGLGRASGEGNEHQVQCSSLGKAVDRDPGCLQSVGLQRVGHNRATNMLTCSYTEVALFPYEKSTYHFVRPIGKELSIEQ